LVNLQKEEVLEKELKNIDTVQEQEQEQTKNPNQEKCEVDEGHQ